MSTQTIEFELQLDKNVSFSAEICISVRNDAPPRDMVKNVSVIFIQYVLLL